MAGKSATDVPAFFASIPAWSVWGTAALALGVVLVLLPMRSAALTTGCASPFYLSARDLYVRADSARAAGDLQGANRLADFGIATLEREHLPTSKTIAVLDDTGQHLTVAHYWARHGYLGRAVNEKVSVLSSRLG